MAYVVKIFPRAERNLAGLYAKINAEHSDAALRWYQGLRESILSLDEYPNRCPVTPENAGLRHLLYGRKFHVYRIMFRVVEKQKWVEVLHIRHGARQEIKASNLT
jgi:toxin ParE1/3/4